MTPGGIALAMIATLALLLSSLAVARPVAAHEGTQLHEDHRNTSWDDPDLNKTGGADCDAENMAMIGADQVLWHFVLTPAEGDALPDTAHLTADFATQSDVTVESRPKDGNGALHFYVVSGADTLVTAWVDTDAGMLVLSHICDKVDDADIDDVSPILECVVMNGENDYTAYFGYNNPTDETITEAVGENNKFTPAPEDRGQPTEFLPGRTPYYPNAAFSVDFDGSNLVWKLGDSTATASANSKMCEGQQPGEDEEEGWLEIIKFFCPTEGEESIHVFGPLHPEGIGTQHLDHEDELPSDEGCTLGADAEGNTASFRITGEDDFELVVNTEAGEISEGPLPVGDYVIEEYYTGLTAEFSIEAEADTAIVVFNYEEADEVAQGLVKVIKFYCDGADDDVVFTIVEGEDVPIGSVDIPATMTDCEPGDAEFTMSDGEVTSPVFDLGDDGARLLPIEVGDTYTLTEVSPNEATSDVFSVLEDEVTTIVVFNVAGEDVLPGEDEEEDEEEVREDVAGGGGGPGGGLLPDTATAGPFDSAAALLVALTMLTGLGFAGQRMALEARRRR